MVIDDEPALRELLVDALDNENIKITTAGSGKEAIKMAKASRPDMIVTDYMLGDCTGLDVIDTLREQVDGDIPAMVITAYGDAQRLTEASKRRPVELMTKPLDLERLKSTVNETLSRQDKSRRSRRRSKRLRHLARAINIDRKNMHQQLDTTCAGLTSAYRSLSSQLSLQQIVIEYQRDLLSAANDDDVFRTLFRLIARQSGPVFGIAMVCNSEAELQIVGRFGVPNPDNLQFCRTLSQPIIDTVLVAPQCVVFDAGEQAQTFDESIRRYLPGLSVLAVPLIPTEGEMIGLAIFYRKGEQPFVDSDLALAELAALPTAVVIRKND